MDQVSEEIVPLELELVVGQPSLVLVVEVEVEVKVVLVVVPVVVETLKVEKLDKVLEVVVL